MKEIPVTKIALLALMAEISHKKTTLERLHQIISKDLSISYKLLRFLNSAYFYRVEEVKNVKHAIAFLGEKELRRFLLLVMISKFAENKPTELIRLSLLRAKFCELLAKNSLLAEYELELFMVGLFSFIDTMLDADMEVIMGKLPVSRDVKDALVHRRGMFSPFVDAVVAYERRQDDIFSSIMDELNIDANRVADIYLESVKYANGLL